jgi:hypothetical protein
MSVETKTVNSNALVYYDSRYTQRWIDAFGVDVVKFLPTAAQDGDSSNDLANFTLTVTEDGGGGDSTVVRSVTAGELFTITSDNADYDGVNLQLEGEAFKLASGKPLYFGIKFQGNDADKEEFVIGLSETETALMAVDTSHALAIAGDFCGITNVGTATAIDFKGFKDGTEENSTALSTAFGDATDLVFEMYWDGSTLYGYENDSLIGTMTSSLPDGDLTPTIEMRTCEADVNTLTVKWWRVIQIR